MNAYQANVTGVEGMMMGGYQRLPESLFFWITITMFWVLMILSITALAKYITHDGKKRK